MQLFPALIRACSAAFLGCLAAPALALAADGEQTPLQLDGAGKDAATHVGASGGGLVRTIVGLAVVIGVIYGLTWVLKQVKSSKQESAGGTGLSSLATLPLGTNRSLHLVRAGDEIHLVGAGEHGVTPIRTYSETEARSLGLLEGDPAVAAFGVEKKKNNFNDQLRDRTVLR
jgi:flagellar protein FliO/FliZ